MQEGMNMADRSRVEPAFMLTADAGMRGGGTVTSGDTDAMLASYENVFGPAARDIKWDNQRHKRHQRWHLPDNLRGANSFLTDRVDGLITDATSSPFTKNILPYHYMDQPDKKIKWNVYSFDEGMASRVPYEAAARVLPQSKRSFAGYAVRQGLAIAMEHNFMMSPQGMENFRRQLMQLVGSIQLTNDLDVHMALLHAPSYQKHMDEKYWDGSKTLPQMCRMYVDLFGFVQKNENALDYLIEDAKNHLAAWGSKPPTFMLCNGALTRQLTMTPEKTNYITAGPDGKRKLAQGPDLPSYRGLSIINTRQFSTEVGAAPRDMLRRRVRVSEHYRIPWDVRNLHKRYEFYDQSRDSMFYLSWMDLYSASFPREPGDQIWASFNQNDPVSALYPRDFDPAAGGDLILCRTFFTDNGGNLNNDHDDLITAARNGRLRRTLFSENEIQLGALLGIWSPELGPNPADPAAPVNQHVHFLQDLEFGCRVLSNQGGGGGRASYATAKLPYNLINSNVLYHLIAMLLVKLYIESKFPAFANNAQGNAERGHLIDALNVGITEINRLAQAAAPPNPVLQNISANCTIHELLGKLYETWSHPNMRAGQRTHMNTFKEWSLGPGTPESTTIEVQCLAADLFMLRPNIEHYMLAVIFGRGGGPEELGATFWGQTELSCYDDSQHGIWGMSYKYHERAIVINERNLIRVFDVCFDGYCGGNDARILQWTAEDKEEFRQGTRNVGAAYKGPSMVVMALPRHKNVFESFPNPIVWHPVVPDASRLKAHPDKGGQPSGESLRQHCPFAKSANLPQLLTHQVYSMYYQALGLGDQFAQLTAVLDPGVLASAHETDPYIFSFHGHMAAILDGQREETQGSGHLGPNFVGVASVREGRGMLPRGMPTLAHLV